MEDKDIRSVVEAQLRDEIRKNWGIDMDQYTCLVDGDVKSALLVEFTRSLNQARIEIEEVYADDHGVLLQWGIPNLL